METVKLELPREFALWQEDGEYRSQELADWFYAQASETAQRFDRRNGSDWFCRDLELSGKPPKTMP